MDTIAVKIWQPTQSEQSWVDQLASSSELEFFLPGLPRLTNQRRVHWSTLRAEATKWKEMVRVATFMRTPPIPHPQIKLELTRFSNREPDFDGLVGSFKNIIDGLVDVGFMEDDNPSILTSKYNWGQAKRGHGYVRVKVAGI